MPVSLTRGSEPHRRGRPYLAEGEAAKAILEKFAELSKLFGAEMTVDAETGRAFVKLA
ncbi:hypothetical protein [Cohnella sp. AR92]|uniref:hypothetical protein n=1 Tax=Cohnella sp. AR92 TaxID=648716 RepID=UPI00131592EE|nr:hypothetical protein [Cohnella sp. AR92]